MIREATAADATAIARVHVEGWRTTYCGIVPDDVLASLSTEQWERSWAERLNKPDGLKFVYVAEDDAGTVVGFASGGPEREGDLVYTDQQGKGIGGRLTRMVAERLAVMGHDTMLVWVLGENPARHFYAALGSVPVREKPITIGGASLAEVAYGWTDTRPLRQRG